MTAAFLSVLEGTATVAVTSVGQQHVVIAARRTVTALGDFGPKSGSRGQGKARHSRKKDVFHCLFSMNGSPHRRVIDRDVGWL